MNKRFFLWTGLAGLGLSAAGFAVWRAALPATPVAAIQPPIAEPEKMATLAALKPPRRARPLIAIIGINDGTETNDYLMPYGILRRAGIADVVALATGPGPVTLFPALTVIADAAIAEFDARHPDGADYVIVPQMRRQDDPQVLAWIKAQSAKGAIVIGVCAGALIVANAGLLDGKHATTHWFYLDRLRRQHPAVRYAADRRLVVDGKVATTTGITAAMPMMLTLIEAIAGRGKAEAVAHDLGVATWDARHDSRAFYFHRAFALTAMANLLPFWRHETLGLKVTPGMDEVSLSLVVDAWSRTYRSRAVTFAGQAEPVRSANGMRIIPDQVAGGWPEERLLPAFADKPPARALDDALVAIAVRHGAPTADFVAMQLEYAGR
jgi:transcriptional regulator GlxA family with amidase domain